MVNRYTHHGLVSINPFSTALLMLIAENNKKTANTVCALNGKCSALASNCFVYFNIHYNSLTAPSETFLNKKTHRKTQQQQRRLF